MTKKFINNQLIDTQIRIKYIKDTFEKALAKKLNLIRVSAPLFVEENSGLNDGLSGKEKSVSFKVNNENIEIVHSLAKWKRFALKEYNFPYDFGLYTDMNAIRKDEALDEIHSIYVDQWDWEKSISIENRNKAYLFKTVKEIYINKDGYVGSASLKWNYYDSGEIRLKYSGMEVVFKPEHGSDKQIAELHWKILIPYLESFLNK